MWPTKVFNIFADITTYCNAGCPQCDRTNPNGLGKVDWLPLISWSLEDFKKAYRPSTLKLTDTIEICGTWGDPIMNKEIYAICKYIMSIKGIVYKSPRIRINTNGSIRDEKWWWDLGVLCGDRLSVIFAVDGKDQEQHEKYRKFTILDKILENMKTLSMTKAKPIAQTLVFKHNQNDLQEIKELCLNNGAKGHSYIWTDRNRLDYTNPDGTKDSIELAERKPEEVNSLNLNIDKKRVYDFSDDKQTSCISCKWLNARRILVNPDGQVLPCCYLGNSFYRNGYPYNMEEHNIFKKPLEDILKESDWFNKELPESWETNPIKQCEKFCSQKGEKHNVLQRLSER